VGELREESAAGGTFGGAILCASGSPTLRDLVFRDNLANLGGGLAAYSAAPSLQHCHFMGNVSGNGGALASLFSGVQIEHCEFHENLSVFGGAIYIEDSVLECHMSVFEGNQVRTDSPCLPENGPDTCGIIGIYLDPGCPQPQIDVRSLLEQYHERIRAIRPQ
jgi:hypothetical protein